MRVKIRTKGFRLFLPVPVTMIGFVARLLPERMFQELRESVPEPYHVLVTRENVRMLLEECLDVFRSYRGLEIVHVEAKDGTFVSIRL